MFIDLFSDYFDNPSYICSDGNLVYEKYCEMFNIPHYIKPSNYSDMLLKNGYDDCKNVEDREKLMLKLYNNDIIPSLSVPITILFKYLFNLNLFLIIF